MRRHDEKLGRPWRRLVAAGMVLAGLVLLGGCASSTGSASSGWLPEGSNGGQVTSETGRVTSLWIGTWIAALVVGAIVWGLTIYVMVRYRRKKDEVGLPPQLRYNVPIEMLYTILPVFMVAVLFYYTARDESALIDVSKKPDIQVNVVAKQWSWDFNYVTANTYESGVQTELNPSTGAPENAMPVLYLPVNKRVEFILNARDVIHSFWVPAFLQKMDMLPGRTNRFQVVPTQEGTFQGKCAELCGAYHSQMLFVVKVVSQNEYDSQMQKLRDLGQSGQLPNTLNREQVNPKDQDLIPTPSGSN
ncbi:cytochrome c oxidase subunit II [Lapillicoccus jejuensis]|nr:cytochrome c oxidase subunit II [Lapillicoccus jejuensis]